MDGLPRLALEAMQPGPELSRLLSTIELARLPACDLVTVVQAWERQKAYDSACQAEAMAQLAKDEVYRRCDGPQGVETGHVHRAVDPCGDELSLALGWSPGRAKRQLMTALDLLDELPEIFVALRAGRIDAEKASLITERTSCLTDPDDRRAAVARVLPIAADKTRTQLDHLLRRAVIAADPAAAERRRAHAGLDRRISRPEPASSGALDGMAYLSLYGPAEDLTALYTAVDAAARHVRQAGDERTLEQLRFDTLTALGWNGLHLGHLGCCSPRCALTQGEPGGKPADDADADAGVGSDEDVVLRGLSDPRFAAAAVGRQVSEHGEPSSASYTLGRRHGKAAAVQVTVAASTLFGSDEQPGWLDGFGPITAQAARRISGEGPWRRLLTDPVTGELLEYGRSTYAPPARLAAHVVARDRTCRFPTCQQSAREADIDHKRSYSQGGTTGAANMWALHKPHHVGKTVHRYRVDTDARGVTWWTTPAGHRYQVEPEAIGSVVSTREMGLDPPPF